MNFVSGSSEALVCTVQKYALRCLHLGHSAIVSGCGSISFSTTLIACFSCILSERTALSTCFVLKPHLQCIVFLLPSTFGRSNPPHFGQNIIMIHLNILTENKVNERAEKPHKRNLNPSQEWYPEYRFSIDCVLLDVGVNIAGITIVIPFCLIPKTSRFITGNYDNAMNNGFISIRA